MITKSNLPKIITAPDPKLRAANKKISQIDNKTKKVLDQLAQKLLSSKIGIGLAAPQIGCNYRVFATNLKYVLPEEKDARGKTIKRPVEIKFFINPEIIKTSAKKVFTKENDGNYTLEGCLSLPNLYAPIPRYEWIVMKYWEIDAKSGELKVREEKFSDFYARNVQHEYDHLDGILFTDYLKDTDLILYREDPKTEQLKEVVDLSFIYAI